MIRRVGTTVALVAASLACTAGSANADVTLDFVSTSDLAGGTDSAASLGKVVSPDGSRIIFTTFEPLVSEDGDARGDAYMRSGGVTTLVSARVDSQPDAAQTVNFEGASVDGTRLLFVTADPLVAADSDDGGSDVYIREGDTTTLLSDSQSDPDPLFSIEPFETRFTPDLSRVWYPADERLGSGDKDDQFDVYEFHYPGSFPSSVSDPTPFAADPDPNDASFDAMPLGGSSDGSRVFFSTKEPLSSDDMDTALDIYQRSSTGITLRSDRVKTGSDAAEDVALSGFSSDGTHLVFSTKEQVLDADSDGAIDIYDNVSGGGTSIVSDRIKDDADAATAVIGTFGLVGVSADGSRVFFETEESLIAADGDGTQDLYERSGGTTTLVSEGALAANFRRITPDASHIFYDTASPIAATDADTASDIYDRTAGGTALITDRVKDDADAAVDVTGNTVVSKDGSRFVFSTAEPLVAEDGDQSVDAYMHTSGGTLLLSDRQQAGDDAAIDTSPFTAKGNANLTDVIFDTEEPLVAADNDGNLDVYHAHVPADPPPPTPEPPAGDPPPPVINPPSLLPGACANAKLGTAVKDLLTGTAAGDRIRGGRGNDRINGLAGRDCLFGEAGNDTLKGGKGDDKLSGGKGNDKLDGADGKDTLDGGTGNDKLTGGSGANKYKGGSGSDTITARNRKRDTIDCGKGKKDKATVDRADRVKGCEKVKRAKR